MHNYPSINKALIDLFKAVKEAAQKDELSVNEIRIEVTTDIPRGKDLVETVRLFVLESDYEHMQITDPYLRVKHYIEIERTEEDWIADE